MNISGGLLGGTAGYNWQTGNWVFGVEGDLDWASMKATQFVTCPASGCTTKFDAFASARAPPGVANPPYLLSPPAAAPSPPPPILSLHPSPPPPRTIPTP